MLSDLLFFISYLAEEIRPLDIELHGFIELLLAGAGQIAHGQCGGVGDENVNAAKLFDRLVDQQVELLDVAGVGLDGEGPVAADLLHHLVGFFGG